MVSSLCTFLRGSTSICFLWVVWANQHFFRKLSAGGVLPLYFHKIAVYLY